MSQKLSFHKHVYTKSSGLGFWQTSVQNRKKRQIRRNLSHMKFKTCEDKETYHLSELSEQGHKSTMRLATRESPLTRVMKIRKDQKKSWQDSNPYPISNQKYLCGR